MVVSCGITILVGAGVVVSCGIAILVGAGVCCVSRGMMVRSSMQLLTNLLGYGYGGGEVPLATDDLGCDGSH